MKQVEKTYDDTTSARDAVSKSKSGIHEKDLFAKPTNKNRWRTSENDQARSHSGAPRRGNGYEFFPHSCLEMHECANESVALTITSPPYWNSIDYDIHAKDTSAWHRARDYSGFGDSLDAWLKNIQEAFREVHRVTVAGGFCAIVVGTILHKGRHFPAPMMVTEKMLQVDWEFHQDIIWNKVTGGVKRAGSFIQRPHSGYFYPNIMTEYVLVFRKKGEMRRGTKKALDIDVLFTRDIANNVWHIAPIPPKTIDHPCPFPEELVRRLVCLYSEEHDVVLDPFLGSGQTALVALREGRKCIGYDVEETYLDLAQERIRASAGGQRQFNLIPTWQKVEVMERERYKVEREVFDRLKADCSKEAKTEYETAIRILHQGYNTTIHENRFIVGGAIEVFTYALLRSVGIDCTLNASRATWGDLRLPDNRRISVKGIFRGGAARVKLINKLGDGQREWRTATFFVVSDVGLVYGTPDIVGDFVDDGNDSIDLTKPGLQRLIEEPANVFKMDIVRKAPTELTDYSLKASTAVAHQIMLEQELGLLTATIMDTD